ncbi:MAG: hypothetical protein HRU41_04910 [Saprospiraceae bacterium]|nr:hypothetical protein [Saprospiraceae bacterium]
MSKLTDVLDLMSALTKSEKRYLTLELKEDKAPAKRKSHISLYVLLAPLLKDGDKDRDLIYQEADNLKEQKNYAHLFTTVNVVRLHDYLLEMLRQFNSDRPEFRLERMIQDVRLLRQKGLSQQAAGVIKKAKKELSQRYENEFKAFELLNLERRLYLGMRQKDFEPLADMQSEAKASWERVRTILEATDDYEKMLYRVRGHEFLEDFPLSPSNEELKINKAAAEQRPFEANLVALATLSHYYTYVEKDPDQAIAYIQDLLRLFEGHRYRKNRYPENYVQVLLLFFNRALMADRIKVFAPIIQKIKDILANNTELFPEAKPSSNQIELSTGSVIQYRLLALMAQYYNYQWADPEAETTMDPIIKTLQRKPNVPAKLLDTLYFNVGAYCLLANKNAALRFFIDQGLQAYQQRPNGGLDKVPIQLRILDVLADLEISRTETDRARLEQKIGDLLGAVGKESREELKGISRNFISRLPLLLLEKDNSTLLDTYKSIRKTLERKQAARNGFIVFHLWVEKKIQALKEQS